MHCGCELGNEATEICSIDGRRQVQLQVSVKTESREIREIVKRHWGLAVIVEAAPRAEWFCREGEAVNKGHPVTIVCPRQAKAVLSGNAKRKTDRMWI